MFNHSLNPQNFSTFIVVGESSSSPGSYWRYQPLSLKPSETLQKVSWDAPQWQWPPFSQRVRVSVLGAGRGESLLAWDHLHLLSSVCVGSLGSEKASLFYVLLWKSRQIEILFVITFTTVGALLTLLWGFTVLSNWLSRNVPPLRVLLTAGPAEAVPWHAFPASQVPAQRPGSRPLHLSGCFFWPMWEVLLVKYFSSGSLQGAPFPR